MSDMKNILIKSSDHFSQNSGTEDKTKLQNNSLNKPSFGAYSIQDNRKLVQKEIIPGDYCFIKAERKLVIKLSLFL